MQPKSTTIIHKPSGVKLETPALIPSFSSKGFGTVVGGVSRATKLLEIAASFVTDIYLISAYDIARAHIPAPANLPMKPDLIVVDSGGYEITEDHDLSTVNHAPIIDSEWSFPDLQSVLDGWPKEQPAVFVSYDHPRDRKPFREQVAQARELFKGRSEQLSCFLLKPETNAQHTIEDAAKSAMEHADELVSFDIIGLTEKELGSDYQERMGRIARFRRALDEVGISAPIHIFGALDPVSVCLYFISGAEMFDGLTWLRYAFSASHDCCLYVHNHSALEYGLNITEIDLQLRFMSANYYYLVQLQERLRDVAASQDLSKLPHYELMKQASERLQRVLKKGGTQ